MKQRPRTVDFFLFIGGGIAFGLYAWSAWGTLGRVGQLAGWRAAGYFAWGVVSILVSLTGGFVAVCAACYTLMRRDTERL